jgi:hypothetical protein
MPSVGTAPLQAGAGAGFALVSFCHTLFNLPSDFPVNTDGSKPAIVAQASRGQTLPLLPPAKAPLF